MLLGEVTGISLGLRNDILILAAVAAAICIIMCNRFSEQRKKCSYLLHFLFYMIGLLLGLSAKNAPSGRFTCDSNISIMGELISADEKKNSIYYIVAEKNTGQKMLVTSTKIEDIMPGEFVIVDGKVVGMKENCNPGGYSEKDYYMGVGVNTKVVAKSIHTTGEKNRVRFFLGCLREKMKSGLYYSMDAETAGTVSAMILGDRGDTDAGIKKLYQESGIAHILAISSLHVMLIGSFLIWLMKKTGLPGSLSAVIVSVILLLYGMMTGFAASTMRAVIMIILNLAAEREGRSSDAATSLIISLLILSIFSPYMLLGMGNVMSVAAISGIITGEMIKRIIFEKERFLCLPLRLRKYIQPAVSMVITSVSINAVMLPIIIHSYYEVPVLSMFLNFLVIPLLTVVVAAAFTAGILGMIAEGIVIGGSAEKVGAVLVYITKTVVFLAKLSGQIVESILSLYNKLSLFTLKIPHSRIICGHTDLFIEVVYYIFFFSILLLILHVIKKKSRAAEWKRMRHTDKLKHRIKHIVYVIGMVAVIECMYVSTVDITNHLNRKLIFLDVGQGNGCIIHGGPDGDFIYDAGSSSTESLGQYVLIPALKYYGIGRVDIIFLTHSDKDHISGVEDLLGERWVGEVRATGMYSHAEGGSTVSGIKISDIAVSKNVIMDDAFLSLKGRFGKDFIYLGKGDKVEKGNIRFDVLFPSGDEDIPHSGNEYSLVSKMTYKEIEVFFTGDIGEEAERLINTYKSEGKLRILTCPHHGSKYSSSEEFLKCINPDITIISCGRNNMYGHPHNETLERLKEADCRIYRTDLQGCVIISIGCNDKKLKVIPFTGE